MNSVLFSLLVVFSQAQDASKGPDAKEIERVVTEIESALAGKETPPKLRALQAASEVPSPVVVKAVTKGFREPEKEVKNAAIQALRWMDHPKALETLHKTFKNDRAIRKDDELTAAVLKGIGQHGDPSSIKVLAGDPFETRFYGAIRARVLGLGMIRDVKSVESLMKMMKLTDQRKIDRYMDDFRLSLMMLTATDQGPSSSAWQRCGQLTAS